MCKQYKNAHRQYQQLLDAFVDAAEAQAKTAVQFELDLALPGFFKRYGAIQCPDWLLACTVDPIVATS